MAFADDVFPISITGIQSITGANQVVSLSQEGSALAASIPVQAGLKFVITDFLISSDLSACEAVIQQTQDGGASWFDVCLQRTEAPNSSSEALESPRVVKGGPNTAIRVIGTPDSGSTSLSVTILGRLEPIQVPAQS
jgi:hypothetical protein